MRGAQTKQSNFWEELWYVFFKVTFDIWKFWVHFDIEQKLGNSLTYVVIWGPIFNVWVLMVKTQFVEYFEEKKRKMGKTIIQPLLIAFGGGSVSISQPSLPSTSSSVVCAV